MNVLRHHDESVNLKPAFAAVAVEGLQEKSHIELVPLPMVFLVSIFFLGKLEFEKV